MIKSKNIETGLVAENTAQQFLELSGLVTIQRNFRCKMGEVDLIMNHQGAIVFVEVRYRSSGKYGGAVESITLDKKKRVERAAHFFLKRFVTLPPCRFDVVVIEGNSRPQWIQNAW